jgi:DNA-binding response OmpR family regulator/chromosome segregation ATPase
MATKVLVFESDPSFAGELRTELGRLGLVAQVVDDGYTGLMAAASDKPDLILLSIELPRMNGFSVCNKLKKDPALKDVPLIIMSSESSDDTFEQHRKLRTRAEDYVHKPIAFGELLEHMRPYVQFENGAGPVSSDDAGIIIDDADLAIEGETNGATDAELEPAKVDAEVEAFANTAFDRLLESEALPALESEAPAEDRSTERKLTRASVPARSSMPPRPTVDAEVERLQNEVERQKTENARLERELSTAKSELSSAKLEVQRLQDNEQREAASNEQVVRLQRELDEIRLKAAAGQKVGGVSSREFLDLREALNKKEKEILGLRDQITRKEKELLDASDSALALERVKADLEDRIGALEKEAQDARALAETAKADKEQAAKRAEDFKTRGEKVKAELEVKLAELGGIQKKHEEEMAAALAEARAAEQRARDEALLALQQESEAAKAAAVAAREAELQQSADARAGALQRDADERFTALTRSSEDEQNRLKGELARAVEEGESAKTRLAQREGELAQQQEQALLGQKSELETRHAEQLREVEARASELSTELSNRTEEREVLAREVGQLKDKVGKLEADLAQRKTELSETRDKLAELTTKLEAATAKWAENRASLEHAKDALAAAVAQIEEAEARGV